jgi:hypothetical protein
MLHWKNRLAIVLLAATAGVASFGGLVDGFYW